jgi:hypothetical protein
LRSFVDPLARIVGRASAQGSRPWVENTR